MKLRELRALLTELDKHPRATSVTADGVTVTYRAVSEQVELVPADPPETDDGPLDLPPGLIDPRKRIEKLYVKHGRPTGEQS